MNKPSLLQENIFLTIAKMLAIGQIKKNIGKAMKDLDDAPKIKKSLESMEYWAGQVETELKNFCKSYPDSERCKDVKKDK